MNKTGYIYSLTCNNPKLIYYGSTTRPLNERLAGHKNGCKKKKQCTSKILFEWGNVKINLLEEIQFENKIELREREAYYIINLECVNKHIPNRTKKEWGYFNKNKISKQKLKYYSNNKDKLLKKKQQYYSNNKDEILKNKSVKITCECGLETTKGHYNRHKKSQKHKVYEFLKEIEESNINLVV